MSEILALLNSLKEPKGNILNRRSRRMMGRMMEKLRRREHMLEKQDMLYVTTTVRVQHYHHIQQTQMHPVLKNAKKE
jgi:hypothetical protein